ncbi:VOC family protein [Nocardia bovistercoris]|uniref:VOC family protein n=1 Tax=Nocardia bovistercoris TaxID=2785916 RepID=A0A931IFE9_9NOCA|nr:VOC family protein [Nocardia bovistercoris]MBH0780296.1 VOC family protein [Nocardia bovistercoris]
MPEITRVPPNGTPTWVDLGTPDHRRAMAFYAAVFGWEFEEGPAETGYYTLCLLRGEPVAALAPNPDPDATAFWWNLYFATDDCDAAVERVTSSGGTVAVPPEDVMDQGRLAIVLDPTGAQFGLWQGKAHIGARIVDEPGSIVWSELATARADAAREFYTAVFDFTLEPMSGFDYTVLRRPDGHPIGGIQGEPSAAATYWSTYFEVEDTDAALARVTEAGGTVVLTAKDTPFGRIAVARDPFGADFTLIRSADRP